MVEVIAFTFALIVIGFVLVATVFHKASKKSEEVVATSVQIQAESYARQVLANPPPPPPQSLSPYLLYPRKMWVDRVEKIEKQGVRCMSRLARLDSEMVDAAKRVRTSLKCGDAVIVHLVLDDYFQLRDEVKSSKQRLVDELKLREIEIQAAKLRLSIYDAATENNVTLVRKLEKELEALAERCYHYDHDDYYIDPF